ncbi:MAG: DUF2007 domain-containing protein [Candidatus Eisenbacteria bacterium]
MGERVPVGVFEYRHDAELARSLLEGHGISSWISADDAGGQYVMAAFGGGVQLWVDEDDLDRARDILEQAEP